MSDAKSEDFGDLISFLGDYGLFQVLVIVLLSLAAIPCGYLPMLSVFIADTPEHYCKVSINSTRNGTRVGPDSCSRYKLNGSRTEAAELSNDTEQCLDGWVYSTERYTPTIASEWDLVCDNAWKVPFSTSFFFVGATIGAFISGDLSDRFGRKPVFFFTLVLRAVAPLIQAASVNWVMFCILNSLIGFTQSSSFNTLLILGSEMLSKSARVSFTLLGNCLGYATGYALLALFAYFIRGWRMLLVASAIPSFLFIPMWWVIPESPRWLLQKGRMQEAELVIRNAAKRNGVLAPEVIFRADERSELMQNAGEEKRTYSYVDLIRTPNMRSITILGVIIWMSVTMVYYGISLSTSNLHGNAYLNCFISAAIEIVTCVSTWLLINRVPRPTLLFCTMMFSGIMLLIMQLVPEDRHVMFQMLAMLGKMGITSAFSFLFVFFTELMPTVVRNMGLGITSMAARFSTIVCPFMIYLGVYSKILPYIIFGTISIVASAVTILLPDTRNSKLPDLISQARPIRGCSQKETATQSSQMQQKA